MSGKYVDRGTSISLVVSLGKKTVYYSYQASIDVPGDGREYVSADISISNEDGQVLQRWKNVKVSSMPQLLTLPNIENSSTGTLTVIWTYLDDDGNKQTIEDSQKVNFTEQ